MSTETPIQKTLNPAKSSLIAALWRPMERGKHFKTDFEDKHVLLDFMGKEKQKMYKKEVKLLSNGTIWKTFILHQFFLLSASITTPDLSAVIALPTN